MKKILFPILLFTLLFTGCAIHDPEIIQATKKNDLQAIQNLISTGVDLEIKGDSYPSYTALMWAAKNNLKDAAKLLLGGGAYVNTGRSSGMTALWVASKEGHIEMAKLLLDNGADVNIGGASENTALWIASKEGHIEIAKLLLDNGADVDVKNGASALWTASSNGHIEVVKLLIEKGADVNNKAGSMVETVLDKARSNGHTQIVQLLRNAGAKTETELEIEEMNMIGPNAAICVSLVEKKSNGDVVVTGGCSEGMSADLISNHKAYIDRETSKLRPGKSVRVRTIYGRKWYDREVTYFNGMTPYEKKSIIGTHYSR